MGLPPGTAAAAADSSVWLAEQDELVAERVLVLMRLLGGGRVPARAVGGAVRELQALQRYVGCQWWTTWTSTGDQLQAHEVQVCE